MLVHVQESTFTILVFNSRVAVTWWPLTPHGWRPCRALTTCGMQLPCSCDIQSALSTSVK